MTQKGVGNHTDVEMRYKNTGLDAIMRRSIDKFIASQIRRRGFHSVVDLCVVTRSGESVPEFYAPTEAGMKDGRERGIRKTGDYGAKDGGLMGGWTKNWNQ